MRVPYPLYGLLLPSGSRDGLVLLPALPVFQRFLTGYRTPTPVLLPVLFAMVALHHSFALGVLFI